VGETLNILFFGFITPRKGIETLFEADKFLEVPHRIVIAGGKPVTRGNGFDSYYDSIRSKSEEKENVEFAGFLEEASLPEYFEKADITVLPYRDFYSASGSMHLSLSYGVPVFGSESLGGVLPDELVFGWSGELAEMLERLATDVGYQEEIGRYVSDFRVDRSWEEVSRRILEIYEKAS